MMWKEKYKVGVDLIDEQHKELFNRLSNFIQIVQNETNWDEKIETVKETLTFMQDYVVFHFDAEEDFQEESGYPNIEEHKKIHADFKEGINNYVKIFEKDGFTEEKIQELSAKLMTWLIMHVGRTDQEIGKYIRQKGETAQ
jgi:hemerythrin